MLTFIGISARILHPAFFRSMIPVITPKKHEEYKAMKNVNAYTGPQRFAHRGLVRLRLKTRWALSRELWTADTRGSKLMSK